MHLFLHFCHKDLLHLGCCVLLPYILNHTLSTPQGSTLTHRSQVKGSHSQNPGRHNTQPQNDYASLALEQEQILTLVSASKSNSISGTQQVVYLKKAAFSTSVTTPQTITSKTEIIF